MYMFVRRVGGQVWPSGAEQPQRKKLRCTLVFMTTRCELDSRPILKRFYIIYHPDCAFYWLVGKNRRKSAENAEEAHNSPAAGHTSPSLSSKSVGGRDADELSLDDMLNDPALYAHKQRARRNSGRINVSQYFFMSLGVRL